jgi:hypothetical protein
MRRLVLPALLALGSSPALAGPLDAQLGALRQKLGPPRHVLAALADGDHRLLASGVGPQQKAFIVRKSGGQISILNHGVPHSILEDGTIAPGPGPNGGGLWSSELRGKVGLNNGRLVVNATETLKYFNQTRHGGGALLSESTLPWSVGGGPDALQHVPLKLAGMRTTQFQNLSGGQPQSSATRPARAALGATANGKLYVWLGGDLGTPASEGMTLPVGTDGRFSFGASGFAVSGQVNGSQVDMTVTRSGNLGSIVEKLSASIPGA